MTNGEKNVILTNLCKKLHENRLISEVRDPNFFKPIKPIVLKTNKTHPQDNSFGFSGCVVLDQAVTMLSSLAMAS